MRRNGAGTKPAVSPKVFSNSQIRLQPSFAGTEATRAKHSHVVVGFDDASPPIWGLLHPFSGHQRIQLAHGCRHVWKPSDYD